MQQSDVLNLIEQTATFQRALQSSRPSPQSASRPRSPAIVPAFYACIPESIVWNYQNCQNYCQNNCNNWDCRVVQKCLINKKLPVCKAATTAFIQVTQHVSAYTSHHISPLSFYTKPAGKYHVIVFFVRKIQINLQSWTGATIRRYLHWLSLLRDSLLVMLPINSSNSPA